MNDEMKEYLRSLAARENALSARLRVEKEAFERSNYEEGHDHGMAWAEMHGELELFVRLAAKHEEFDSEKEWWSFLDSQDDLYGWIARQVKNEQTFHESHGGAEALHGKSEDRKFFPGYLRGFVDGILHVWNQVEGKVMA